MSIIPPHDPLCPMAVGPAFANSGPLAYCQCDLIARVASRERDKVGEMGIRAARKGAAIAVTEWKAAFRAQVEALQVFNVDSGVDPYRYVIEPLLRRADVLAVIDGGSDG